jgi:fermentation-respiration switch protein FrsA (DUF1100 family)
MGISSKNTATMIYFHGSFVRIFFLNSIGNAGNLSFCLPNIAEILEQFKVNIMLVSYRGYGKSEGSPTEKGLKIDATSVLTYLINNRSSDIDINNIILFGRSLGGAVSVALSSILVSDPKYEIYSNSIKALILENTFTSIPGLLY